jgi:hypothetical protein
VAGSQKGLGMSMQARKESSGFDLGSFLAEQAEVGQTESTGEFSVAHEKAMEKLAHFSLVGPYTWMLKLLQSIDLFRPKKLTVTQTREKTTFLFLPTHQSPTEQIVIEAFQAGVYRKDDPLAQLCLSLRALVQQAGLSFVLSINGEELSNSPIYSGDDVAKLPESQRLRWSHHTKPGVQLVVSHFKGQESMSGRLIPTFSQWERRDLKIASLLEDNALFHPISIWLDGRYLNSPVTHADYGITTRFRSVLMWGSRLPQDTLARLRVPETFEGQLLSVYTTPTQAVTKVYSRQRDFDCWFLLKARAPGRLRTSGLYFGRKTKHEILWLQNGIVVERSEAKGLSNITEATILLSAEGFGTDLSGLALTRSEKRTEYQTLAVEMVAQQIAEIAQNAQFLEAQEDGFEQEEVPDFRSGSFKDDIVPSLGFGILGGVSLLGITPFLLTAGLSAAGTALVGYAVRKHRSSEAVQEALREKWVDQVRYDLDQLSNLNQLSFKTEAGGGGGRKADELFRPKPPPEKQDEGH